MNVVISQPRYLPGLNYITRLRNADTFVLLDNVQRQYLGIENRNRLITNSKTRWVTMPISSSRKAFIRDTHVVSNSWVDMHKSFIRENYKKAPCYNEDYLETYYNGIQKMLLSGQTSYLEIIKKMLYNLQDILQESFNMITVKELGLLSESKGTRNLVDIVACCNGDTYISGPMGRDYGVNHAFRDSGIKIFFHDYVFEEYFQYNSDNFIFGLAFFDLLFNEGLYSLKRHTSEKKWSSELYDS